MAWRQRSASAAASRRGVGQHRQHERLGVPERVPVVARAGQALGRDRAPLGPRARLQRVEEREAHGLLELLVAVDLDVGARPRSRPGTRAGRASSSSQPARRADSQRRVDLVAHRRQRAPARPAVGEELGHASSPRRGASSALNEHAREVAARRPAPVTMPVGPVDHVVHRRRHPQPAVARPVHEHRAQVVQRLVLGASAARPAPRPRAGRRCAAGRARWRQRRTATTTRSGSPSSALTS